MLDLHATALVSVLDAAAAQAAGEVLDVVRVDVAGVLGELLAHEERFWLGTAGRAGLLDGVSGLRPQVLRRIVAATCLLGAATEEDAAALVARVPGAVASAKVVGWLRDLYPPHADGDWLGSLQPDRLAERLAVAELAASPVLADACLTDLNDRQATREGVRPQGRGLYGSWRPRRRLRRLPTPRWGSSPGGPSAFPGTALDSGRTGRARNRRRHPRRRPPRRKSSP
jgi:hypothetical protein